MKKSKSKSKSNKCDHGRGNSKVRAASDAIVDDMNQLTTIMLNTKSEEAWIDIYITYRSRIKNRIARFQQPDGSSKVVAHLNAMAAKEILAGNLDKGRDLARDAIEVKSFEMEDANATTLAAATRGDAFLRRFFDEIQSERGLIRYVSKQLPCKCLTEKAKALKAAAKTGMCDVCHKEILMKDLLQCGRCKMTTYCSPECQAFVWKKHKIACDEIASELKIWKSLK